MMDKKKIIIISAVAVITVIIIVVVVINKKKTSSSNTPDTKEPFFNAANGAFVDPNTKVIRGNNLFTDQMVFDRDANTLLNDVKNDMYYSDPNQNFGAPLNKNNFNSLYANQLAIQKINNRTENQVMSEEDMKEINKKLLSSSNNSKYNLYDRGAAKNVQLSIEPNGTRAVIDGDYLGARDKNHQISVVKRVIPVHGFDMDIERIPEIMAKHQSAKNKLNKEANKTNLTRKPAEAAMKTVEQVVDTVKDLTGASDKEVEEHFKNTRTSSGFLVDGNFI